MTTYHILVQNDHVLTFFCNTFHLKYHEKNMTLELAVNYERFPRSLILYLKHNEKL